jgi:hypothetical protein
MFDEETNHKYMKKSKKDLVAIIESEQEVIKDQLTTTVSLNQQKEKLRIEVVSISKQKEKQDEEIGAQKRLLLLSNNNYHELERAIHQITALNFPEWPRLGIDIGDDYTKQLSPREKAPEEYIRLQYILGMVSKGKFMTDLSGYDKIAKNGECNFIQTRRDYNKHL